MDCKPPVSSVHGILQPRILPEAVPFSRGSSQPRGWTQVSHIAGRFFTICATREAKLRMLLVNFRKNKSTRKLPSPGVQITQSSFIYLFVQQIEHLRPVWWIGLVNISASRQIIKQETYMWLWSILLKNFYRLHSYMLMVKHTKDKGNIITIRSLFKNYLKGLKIFKLKRRWHEVRVWMLTPCWTRSISTRTALSQEISPWGVA